MNMLILSNFLREFYLMRQKLWSDDNVDSWVKGQFHHITMSKNTFFFGKRVGGHAFTKHNWNLSFDYSLQSYYY